MLPAPKETCQAEPVLYQALEDLQLDLAHELDVDLAAARSFQSEAELGVLLLQLAQLAHGGVGVQAGLQLAAR